MKNPFITVTEYKEFRTAQYQLLRQEKIGDLVTRTVRRIYKEQGYYSALVFLINAGLAPRDNQEAAENELMARL